MSHCQRVPSGGRKIRNQEYLISLDPDRLLAWFRREAGLTPKAPVYGGWESEVVAEPNQSLPGAIPGFYLSSMANCYDSTHDPRIRERLTYMVAGLAECRRTFGDGYLLPTKNGHQLFERVAGGEIVTSNPLINGVRDRLTGLEAQRAEARTRAVDTVIAGDTTSENVHKYQDVNTKVGVEEEQSWRRATAGGWMSYQLAVQPATDHELWIEYHRAEFEPNHFTILINGQHISEEENLKNFDLPVRYVRPYRFPATLVGPRHSQAPGNLAGCHRTYL